jgi:putative PIN family toxin of toxin-antitoxin system
LIVVFDTNVLISALQFGQSYGPPVRALEKALREDMIATADELEDETFRVLTEKFNWKPEIALAAIRSILIRSMRCRLKHSVKVCRDPKDNMFLECAALTRADFIVAGDKDLLVLGNYRHTRIVTPAQYIALLP